MYGGGQNELSVNHLKRFSDEYIIEQIGMANMPKIIFVLEKKYKQKAELIPIENDVMLRVGNTNAANLSYLAVYLHFMSMSGNILHLEGNISLPASIKNYEFCVKINQKKQKVALEDKGFDLKILNEVYENRKAFSTEILLETEKQNEIEFFNEINELECRYGKINAMRFMPIADNLKGQYAALGKWIAYIYKNKILISKVNESELINFETNFQREIKKQKKQQANWIIELRQNYFQLIKKKEKPIWLIMDRTDRADDNGEIFFRYMKNHLDIDTYFIIDDKCKDYERLKSLGNIAALYSKQHYLLFLLADFVISSQCNGCVENPFWEDAEYFRDLYHKPKLIFLQHGVIKDDMSLTLHRYHTNFTGFVTSTEAEWQSILKYPYYYSKENVWLTGLPVFDKLKNCPKRIILIAPTWRMDCMKQEWDKEKNKMSWLPKQDITKTIYYKKYRALLQNKVLSTYCKRYSYQIVLKPHPLIEPYIKEIVKGTNVLLANADMSYQKLLSEAKLMVTDYSSLAFEFAYLKKTTLYYQFDKKKFFESHTYREGYFNYKQNGFGEVCTSEWELVRYLISYIKRDCIPKTIYQERMEHLFPYHGGACERIYQKIKTVGMKIK